MCQPSEMFFTILTFMPAVISKYPAVVDVFGNVRSVSVSYTHLMLPTKRMVQYYGVGVL